MANHSITLKVSLAWWVRPVVFLTFLFGKVLHVSEGRLNAITDKLIIRGITCRQ